LARIPAIGALAALILLVIVNAIVTPNFATTANALNILWQASSVVLVGIGMTLVIGTSGIDLSVGSVMAIAGAVAAVQLAHGVALAIVLALAAAILVGTVNGSLASRVGVQPIVVTLATLIAGRGLAQVLSNGGELVPIRNASFDALGRGALLGVPVPVLVAALCLAAAAFMMRASVFGRYVVAVGGNRRAARLAGVPVTRTIISAYVLSALLAGVAGLLEVARVGASDAAKLGLNVELDAIAATVVGGTVLTGGRVTILGTVIGALVMQVIATSFNMLLLPYAWSMVFKAGITVVAVYLQRNRAS